MHTGKISKVNVRDKDLAQEKVQDMLIVVAIELPVAPLPQVARMSIVSLGPLEVARRDVKSRFRFR